MLNKMVERPIAVSMIIVALLALGIFAASVLPISLVPDVDAPMITVQVSSPNMSARQMNEAALKPLRGQLMQLAGIEDINSEARDGSGTITLKFNYGASIDFAFIEVNEKIDRAMSSLPNDMERPKAVKASATDIPAFYLNLELKGAKDDFTQFSTFARSVLIKRIEQLPDVAMVDISGDSYSQIVIIPNEDKLERLGVSFDVIKRALLEREINLGTLSIKDGEYQYSIRFDPSASSIAQIRDSYIKIDGRLYKISELAKVESQEQKRKGMVLSDGQEGITLAIIKQSDAQMRSFKESFDELLVHMRSDYPQIDFKITRDQTQLLEYSINNLIQNIIMGALLACFVIFIFMRDIRTPLLIVITIPLSIILSLLVMYLLGITINIISLSGLILGMGMIVDNSIIVIDNITRRLNGGEPLRLATTEGAREVFMPMLSSVLTTCAIFVPLIFMGNMAGALFYDQALSVAISLFSSLVVTITAIPVYYYQLHKHQRISGDNFLHKLVAKANMHAAYERGLKWCFRKQRIVWAALAVLMVVVGVIFTQLEKETLPHITENDTMLTIHWNERLSIEESAQRSAQICDVSDQNIEQTTIMAGAQNFMLSHTPQITQEQAIIYIKAKDEEHLKILKNDIAAYIGVNYPSSQYEFSSSDNVFNLIFGSSDAQLVARLRSMDGDAADPHKLNILLNEISIALGDIHIKPAAYSQQIAFAPRGDIMALYGVSVGSIVEALRNSLTENELYRVIDGSESIPVIIGRDRISLASLLESTYIEVIDSQQQETQKLSVATFLYEVKSQDLKSIVSGAEGNYYPLEIDVPSSRVPQIIETIDRVVLDDTNFEVSYSGNYFTTSEMLEELITILVVALLLLYFILAAQLESMVQPLIILSEIVIDLFGAFALMWLFGVTLNIMSMIGLIVMCGIVINDSILKIDTINRIRREDKKSLLRAILEGGNRRLTPIIMTSLTTILAISPFLITGDKGSDLQYPLSIALIGGMIIGTLVSLYFIPLVYYLVYKGGKKW